MKTLRRTAMALLAGTLALAGVVWGLGNAAEPAPTLQSPTAATPFVVHEWGTFTSFSGSDGVDPLRGGTNGLNIENVC